MWCNRRGPVLTVCGVTGVFQCGPCPVKAVKNGDTNVGFDTAFVFGEVNADEVCWVVNAENEIVNYSCVREKKSVKLSP